MELRRRRDLPGMQASGPNSKEDLSKRLYNQDGSRNFKGEKDRLKAKHPMSNDFSDGGKALMKKREAQVTEILNKLGAFKQ